MKEVKSNIYNERTAAVRPRVSRCEPFARHANPQVSTRYLVQCIVAGVVMSSKMQARCMYLQHIIIILRAFEQMKDKIDIGEGGEQEQPTSKKPRLSIVNESSPTKEQKYKTPYCDIRPPPFVLDLDSDLNRTITFGGCRSVVVDHQIAEGGFGAIFIARDAKSTNKKRKHVETDPDPDCSTKSGTSPTTYALKRIDCCNRHGQTDQQKVVLCNKEATLYSTFQHKNLMEIIGLKFDHITTDDTRTSCSIKSCYMLFPFIPRSVRDDISARRLLEDTEECNRRPYSEHEALELFAGIADGLNTLHAYGFSHRDIKLENIMLRKCPDGPGIPVIADFGSVGPVFTPLTSRADAARVEEDVAKHTSLEYRAPELLEPKRLTHGPKENLNYAKCDVWALGCVFFAILYGSSPFEIEWGISFVGEPADGTARLTICTPDLIRGDIPFPPGGSAAERRYSESFRELIECILNKDRYERLSCENVAGRVQIML